LLRFNSDPKPRQGESWVSAPGT